MGKVAFDDFMIDVARPVASEPGLMILPWQRPVEPTFTWTTRCQHLVQAFEQQIDVVEAMIPVALESLLLRCITRWFLLERISTMPPITRTDGTASTTFPVIASSPLIWL